MPKRSFTLHVHLYVLARHLSNTHEDLKREVLLRSDIIKRKNRSEWPGNPWEAALVVTGELGCEPRPSSSSSYILDHQ